MVVKFLSNLLLLLLLTATGVKRFDTSQIFTDVSTPLYDVTRLHADVRTVLVKITSVGCTAGNKNMSTHSDTAPTSYAAVRLKPKNRDPELDL